MENSVKFYQTTKGEKQMSKIKEYRIKNNITQRYIAYKLGVSQQAVCKWEAGENSPNIKHLITLSALIGCPIEELIGQ